MMNLKENKPLILVFISLLIFGGMLSPSISGGDTSIVFSVNPNDNWTYTVIKAYKNLKYSIGILESQIKTIGYQHGDVLLNEGEKIDLTILSVDSNPSGSVIYQTSSKNVHQITEFTGPSIEMGIQESLGRGILGEGPNFLENTSGVTLGNWVFFAPNNNWPSLLQLWNQSIPELKELEGVLEGIESIKILGDSDKERDYRMWIQYSGTMKESSLGLDLDFTYDASFHWEKMTGVLLSYDISTQMVGTYNESFTANFNLDVRLDRDDLSDFQEQATPGFLFVPFLIILTLFIGSRRLRRKFA